MAVVRIKAQSVWRGSTGSSMGLSEKPVSLAMAWRWYDG
jgi:hypothetical protein